MLFPSRNAMSQIQPVIELASRVGSPMADQLPPIAVSIAHGFDAVHEASDWRSRFLIGRCACVVLVAAVVVAAFVNPGYLLFLVAVVPVAFDVEWGLRNVRQLSAAAVEGRSDASIADGTITIRHPSLEADIVIRVASIRAVAIDDIWGSLNRFPIMREPGGLYPVGTPKFLFGDADRRWPHEAPIVTIGYRTGVPTVVFILNAAHEVSGLFDRVPHVSRSRRFSSLTDNFVRRVESLRPIGLAFRTDQPELVRNALSARGVRVGLTYDDWAHVTDHVRLTASFANQPIT
jgi:hypothetical protein